MSFARTYTIERKIGDRWTTAENTDNGEFFTHRTRAGAEAAVAAMGCPANADPGTWGNLRISTEPVNLDGAAILVD